MINNNRRLRWYPCYFSRQPLTARAFLTSFAVQDFLKLIAVNIPRMIAYGVGGQPGTATSTGITLDTRPQLA